MSGNETILLIPHAAVFLLGLPFLIRLITDLVADRGPGLPAGGAWPNVVWARAVGGYLFLVGCIILQFAVLFATGYLSAPLLDVLGLAPQVGPGAAAELTPPAMAVTSLLMCANWIVVCGLIIAYILHAGGRPSNLGLTPRRLPRTALQGLQTWLAVMPLVLVLLVSFYMLYGYLVEKPPALHPVLVSLQHAAERWPVVVLVVTGGLVLPFFEELFWRGIILTGLLRTGSAAVAIIISAVFFAASHQWENGEWVYIPALLALGLGLGYVYYRTGSLAASVAMHAAFNLYNIALTLIVPTLHDTLSN